MPHRLLALVTALAAGDYLLWNWSLGGNHDIVALVSGLTLPPLFVALVWALAMSLARLPAWVAQGRRTPSRAAARSRTGSAATGDADAAPAGRGTESASSSKLAA